MPLHFPRQGVREEARNFQARAARSQEVVRSILSLGDELEQIQFLLGHISVQTTEKYLGCKQRLRQSANDRLGIEPIL